MPYSPDSFTAGEVPTTAKWNKLWNNDADFDTRIQQAAPPGIIQPYGGSSAPSGWLLCDGSAVSRTTYAALFAILGTVFGAGNGSTTFNLPDLRGKIPVGRDSGQTEFDVVGETGGAKTHTLAATELPAISGSWLLHGQEGGTFVAGKSGSATGTTYGSGYKAPPGTTGGSTSQQNPGFAFGGGLAHNNLQPYQVVNYLIKI